MVFLELFTLPNGTGSPDQIVIQTVGAVPGLASLILAFVWFVAFLFGIGAQKARSGTADYAMWAVVSSLMTMFVALIMTTVTGIISLTELVIVVVVTIFSGVWLFLDRRASEF